MQMRALPVFLAVGFGLLAASALAGELSRPASDGDRVAFLVGRGVAAQSSSRFDLVQCKTEGAACTSDSGCCTNTCRPVGEGRACVAKTVANGDPGPVKKSMPQAGTSDAMEMPTQPGHTNPHPAEQPPQGVAADPNKQP